MTDIVERLHEAAGDYINDLYSEAAEEIERLRSVVRLLQPAVEHIAQLNGTYVHVAINAVATAAIALYAIGGDDMTAADIRKGPKL